MTTNGEASAGSALAVVRRPWLTGAGVAVVVAVVVTAMVLAHRGSSSPQPFSAGAALEASTSATSSEAPDMATRVAWPTASVVPSATIPAPSSATTAATQAAAIPAISTAATPSSPAPTTTRTTGLDVDGDGRPDAATTTFVDKRTARLTVHLGNGKSLTSKVFPLYHGDGAGAVFGYDLTGDGHDELLVSEPGADGVGYELFTVTGGALAEVSAPHGWYEPFLYIGGGIYYSTSFGCSDRRLELARERPAAASTASLPPDPEFEVTSTEYALTGARLVVTSSHTSHVANRAAAQALLGAVGNGCGTKD